MFIVGVDLGQSQDFTAITVVERLEGTGPKGRPENAYHLRHLERPALGTRYPAIVARVMALLGTPPLDRETPLIVDKTGVGGAVVDMFAAAGVRPRAVTITGGTEANREDPFNLRVPKRELASTLVSLYQARRLKTAKGLDLVPTLLNELVNFKVKINIATGNASYEAWRESIHDDLVLAVALATWYGEQAGEFAVGVATFGGPPAAGRGPSFEAAGILAAHIRRARGEEPEPAGDDDDDDAGPVIAVAGPTGNPHDPRNILRLLGGRS